MNSSSNSTASPSLPKGTSAMPGITPFTQITYSVIATVAFLGNTLVICVFGRERTLLKKSYNILILTLAITDVLTATLLVTNPAFVLGDSFPYPTNHVMGEIFCRFFWNRVFLFQLVIFSAYICLALSTERWYAVVKPFNYSNTFNTKRTLIYILAAWVWSLILCGSTFFEVGYVPSNPPSRRCKWLFLWGKQPTRAIVGLIQVSFKMIFPCLTMLALYGHMVYKTTLFTASSASREQGQNARENYAYGGSRLPDVDCMFGAQSDQLRAGNGGKGET